MPKLNLHALKRKWSNSRQSFGKVEDRRMNSLTLCLFRGSNMGEASSTRLDIHWHSWFSLCSTVYPGLLRITQCTQGPWEDYDIWILSSTPTVVFLNCLRFAMNRIHMSSHELQWNQLRNWWSPIGHRPCLPSLNCSVSIHKIHGKWALLATSTPSGEWVEGMWM